MKNFKDLTFESHGFGEGLQARMFFENGYGVSVVRFMVMGRYGSYTDNESEWELAVLRGNEDDATLAYDTDITDDVLGHLSSEDVSDIMVQVQSLPNAIPTNT